MNNVILVSILLFIYSFTTSAQESTNNTPSPTIEQMANKAYEIGSITLWEQVVTQLNAKYQSSRSSQDLLNLCHAYYGMSGTCLGMKKKEKGLEAISKSIELVELLSKDKDYAGEAHAILAGLYGLQIAFQPMKGMFLGPKSDKDLKKAFAINDNNAFAWLQQGSSLFHTPAMFGGDVEKSIDSFRKSVELYEADDSLPKWLKIEAMIMLAQALHKTEKYKKALTVYDNILNEMPNNSYVKKVLRPATAQKIGS